MALYEQWQNLFSDKSDEEYTQYFQLYLLKEKDVYAKLLANKQDTIKGKVSDLAKEFELTDEEMCGFLDGINESIEKPMDIEKIEADSEIDIKIIWKELYRNMLKVPAEWLFDLDEWDNIYTVEERKEIKKEYNAERQAKSEKVGRNEPCPCGSGKKFKKCCGKGL